MSVHELDQLEQGRRAARHVYYADSLTLIQFLWVRDLWETECFRKRTGYYQAQAERRMQWVAAQEQLKAWGLA